MASRRFSLAMVLGAAALVAACSSSGPSAPPAGRPPASRGTLGIEARSISRAARKRLSLPEDLRGVLVVELHPGGPAALAGLRPDDVVEKIGDTPVGNSCDFEAEADDRPITPVRVVVRRGGNTIEASVAPIERKAFWEDRCRQGSASACYRRARAEEATDQANAASLLESACRTGSPDACADAGIRLVRSGNRPDDAVSTLERACTLGSGAGCAHEAFLYATGRFVDRDDRRAASLYLRGCDLGDAPGCYNVGLMADEGRGSSRSLRTAVARYDEACEGGSSAACTNLGFFYENGRGVPRNAAHAADLYGRGCDGSRCQPSNLTGCVNLGRAYRDGIGVEKDPARAEATFRDACDRPVDPDDVGAESNRSRACSLLGALFLDRDPAKGLQLSELGCDRGDAFGCFNAAAIVSGGSAGAPNPVRAASFLDRACRAGDGEGCFDLGVAYEKGNGVAADREKAAESFKRACELGFQKACGRKAR
jgi:TPR repeat protein